jgi:hypothetical protein
MHLRQYLHFRFTCIFSGIGRAYCNSTYDTVTCWPTTLGGQNATMSCPDEHQGLRYDATSKYYSIQCEDFASYVLKL